MQLFEFINFQTLMERVPNSVLNRVQIVTKTELGVVILAFLTEAVPVFSNTAIILIFTETFNMLLYVC